MAWRDQLRPASFRGVPFETMDLGATLGRDGVEQEPVGDNGVYFDDLGRKARRFQISAFIVATGDASDYLRRRDALIAAVEELGSGQLVHPTFGTLIAQNTSCELNESFDEGRVANFRLSFVEVGEGRTFPQATVDAPAVVNRRAATLDEEIEAFFDDVYDVTGQLDYVVSAAEDEIADRVAIVESIVDRFSEALEDVPDIRKKIDGLSATGATLVADVVELMEAVADREPLVQIATAITPPTVSATNPNDRQAQRNRRVVALLFRVSALSAAAAAAAEEDFTAYDDATRARDAIVDAIVVDEERDDVVGDLYDALAGVRTGVWNDLTERAVQLPRIVTYTPAGVTSALELAQLLYQDGGRADEIIKRNNLDHPGFVPAQPLKVLAS